MNALELVVLLRRLRVAVVHSAAPGREASGSVRGLLVEAAEAIEGLVAEREGLVDVWNSGLPALDGPCLECEGAGCGDCGGSGVLPTTIGLQILGFLDRAGWRPA